jgi:bifunctional UDP-N-acetylglucosamine pyrophosphorylase/glucosamine-1-phosphate N-acetyltransferase
MDSSISAIVLAAGRGSRMKAPSDKNKVVFTLAEKPIITYTLDLLKTCGFQSIIVVIGFASESVKQALGNQVTYAVQENPQGTGHAVMVALPELPVSCTTVVCMYGDDSAFYPSSLIETLIEEHRAHQAVITLVTLDKANPIGLGRIVRNPDTNQVTEIVEEKNASEIQKKLTEINTGLYCFDALFLTSAIKQLEKNPISGEYYLTDVISNAVKSGKKVHVVKWPSDDIWFGVNTPEQLKEAEARMKAKVR